MNTTERSLVYHRIKKVLHVAIFMCIWYFPNLTQAVQIFNCASADSTCLTNAINAANGTAVENEIRLQAGRYVINTASLRNNPRNASAFYISETYLTIKGEGAYNTIIERSNTPGVEDFRLFSVSQNANLTLVGLALRNGEAQIGGALLNLGWLVLNKVRIERNTSTGINHAGALYNGNHMTVNNTVFVANTALGQGGAVVNEKQANGVISNSRIVNNTAVYEGGGIYNEGELIVKSTNILNNRLTSYEEQYGGGGVSNYTGELRMLDSTVTRNRSIDGPGAGISNFNGQMVVKDSAVVLNHSKSGLGVGIYSGQFGNAQTTPRLWLTSVTIAGNKANRGKGAGLYIGKGVARLTNTSILKNRITVKVLGEKGIGLSVREGAYVFIRNTMLTNNRAENDVDVSDCDGTVISRGFNQVHIVGACNYFAKPSDLIGFDGRLKGIVESAQPGRSYVQLFAVSPAIDAISTGSCAPRDQLKQPRLDGNGDGVVACDIGAVEFRP